LDEVRGILESEWRFLLLCVFPVPIVSVLFAFAFAFDVSLNGAVRVTLRMKGLTLG
jgi:hypothetical protein